MNMKRDTRRLLVRYGFILVSTTAGMVMTGCGPDEAALEEEKVQKRKDDVSSLFNANKFDKIPTLNSGNIKGFIKELGPNGLTAKDLKNENFKEKYLHSKTKSLEELTADEIENDLAIYAASNDIEEAKALVNNKKIKSIDWLNYIINNRNTVGNDTFRFIIENASDDAKKKTIKNFARLAFNANKIGATKDFDKERKAVLENFNILLDLISKGFFAKDDIELVDYEITDNNAGRSLPYAILEGLIDNRLSIQDQEGGHKKGNKNEKHNPHDLNKEEALKGFYKRIKEYIANIKYTQPGGPGTTKQFDSAYNMVSEFNRDEEVNMPQALLTEDEVKNLAKVIKKAGADINEIAKLQVDGVSLLQLVQYATRGAISEEKAKELLGIK